MRFGSRESITRSLRLVGEIEFSEFRLKVPGRWKAAERVEKDPLRPEDCPNTEETVGVDRGMTMDRGRARLRPKTWCFVLVVIPVVMLKGS